MMVLPGSLALTAAENQTWLMPYAGYWASKAHVRCDRRKWKISFLTAPKTVRPLTWPRFRLTFDNTKNILPTEFSQVTLTRKLYRTGDSEYRLNDVQCRLKDITDLFPGYRYRRRLLLYHRTEDDRRDHYQQGRLAP
jgi:hypothetical protein